MAICRYWQQGQCRFGNQCKYEHGTPNPGGFIQPRAPGGSGDMTNTLVQTVKVDLEQWEKGNQWIFSCYSPAKDTACFPGLDDMSQEELRWEAYTAKINQNVNQYQQKIQAMINEYAQKRNLLRQPSDQVKTVLLRIYNREDLTGFHNVLSGQPVNTAGNVFGGSGSTSSSIFGSAPQPSGSSIFGSTSSSTFGAPSVFGSSANSAFGSSNNSLIKPAATASIFGQSNMTSANSSSGSIFSNPATTQPTSNLFGQNTSTMSSGSIFGNANKPTSVFGQASNNPSPQAPQTTSVFGQPANTFGQPATIQPSPFLGPTTTQGSSSIFGSSPSMSASTSVFGQPTTSPFTQISSPASSVQSTFGQAAFSQPPTQASNPSPFGQPPAQSQTTFGTNLAAPQPSVFGSPSTFGQPSVASTSAISIAPYMTTSSAAPLQGSPAVISSNPFGTPPPSISNPFEKNSSSTSSEKPTMGLFGQKIIPQKDSSIYTQLDDLTEEEKEQFSAVKFELGKIPLRPPPKEMCV